MIVIVLAVIIFLLMRWIKNRVVIPKKYELDSDVVNQLKSDQAAATKRCIEKLEQRKKLEEEKAKEKPMDFFEEVDKMIAEKKKLKESLSKTKKSDPDKRNKLKGRGDPKKDEEHSDYIKDLKAFIDNCKY